MHFPLFSHATDPLRAGGILVILSAAFGYAAHAKGLVTEFFTRLFCSEFEILGEDLAYTWLEDWLNVNKATEKSRRFLASATASNNLLEFQATGFVNSTDDGDETEYKPIAEVHKFRFLPMPGNHVVFYKRRPLWVTFHREANQGGQRDSVYRKSVFVRCFGRNPQFLRDFLKDVWESAHDPSDNRTTIFMVSKWGDAWQPISKRKLRTLNSVVLPTGRTEAILTDMCRFLARESEYQNAGIPYRRTYLFHGVPGSGKSSLVMGLARELGLDIYILNLSNPTLDDAGLIRLLALMGTEKCLVLIEDIDCVNIKRDGVVPTDPPATDQYTPKTVTLSGVLNAIDGVAAKEGRILIMTANRKDLLDPALIRRGRVDWEEEFKKATPEQVERIFLNFFPGQLVLAQTYRDSLFPLGKGVDPTPVAMSQVQSHLLHYWHDAAEAASTYDETYAESTEEELGLTEPEGVPIDMTNPAWCGCNEMRRIE